MRSLLSLWVFDWRKLLAYTHRWLGIAGCVLFVAWFVSGIVMMYARMPGLADEERLARAAVLDLSAVALSPAEAAERASVRATNVQVGMLRGRPVYRFGGREQTVVFADTGELFEGMVDEREAREVARLYAPGTPGRFDWRSTSQSRTSGRFSHAASSRCSASRSMTRPRRTCTSPR